MSTALEKDVVIAEYARTVFAFTPSESVEYDALLDPAFWANVGHKVKPGCQIEVLAPAEACEEQLPGATRPRRSRSGLAH